VVDHEHLDRRLDDILRNGDRDDWRTPADVTPLGVPRGLGGDGWSYSKSPCIVILESQVHPGSAAYVRTLATPEHPRVGTFRGDADEGTCERVRGSRFDRVSLEGSTDGDRCAWSAVLSQIDGRKGWHRHEDGGFISELRARSGRYDERAPTNRKRKRERCKVRRRLRQRLTGPKTGPKTALERLQAAAAKGNLPNVCAS